MRSRGHRNNNPGNLRISGSRWKGKVPAGQNSDQEFEQFETLEHGVRALIKLLRDSYMKRKGLNTVFDIISRYAPKTENATNIYAEFVAERLEVDPFEKILPAKCTIKFLVQAIDAFENGSEIITDMVFNSAWKMSK